MNKEIEVDLKNVRVVVGMPAHRTVVVPTVISLCQTVSQCRVLGCPLEVILTEGSSVVMTARNQIAHAFLKTVGTHLFWIDSDIQWGLEQFYRVLAMSTVFDTARAVYPRRQERVVFDREGIGFCCVKRKVIETLAAQAPTIWYGEVEPCAAIFRESFVPSETATRGGAEFEYYSEDSTFFVDVEKAGFTSWIDPKSNLGHVGAKTYRASVDDLWEVATDGTADRMREEPRQESEQAGT
jgi:hypothetical protein